MRRSDWLLYYCQVAIESKSHLEFIRLWTRSIESIESKFVRHARNIISLSMIATFRRCRMWNDRLWDCDRVETLILLVSCDIVKHLLSETIDAVWVFLMIFDNYLKDVVEFFFVSIISSAIVRSVCSFDSILKTMSSVVVSWLKNIVYLSFRLIRCDHRVRWIIDLLR